MRFFALLRMTIPILGIGVEEIKSLTGERQDGRH
jgi:hypothetical protein